MCVLNQKIYNIFVAEINDKYAMAILALRTSMFIFGLIDTGVSISSGIFLFLSALEKSSSSFGLINANSLVSSVHHTCEFSQKRHLEYHFVILFFVKNFFGILSCHKVLNQELIRVLLMVKCVYFRIKKIILLQLKIFPTAKERSGSFCHALI